MALPTHYRNRHRCEDACGGGLLQDNYSGKEKRTAEPSPSPDGLRLTIKIWGNPIFPALPHVTTVYFV